MPPLARAAASCCRVASHGRARHTPCVASALPTPRLAALVAEFAALPEGPERYKLLLSKAAALPALPPAARTLDARVMGCTSQTWLVAELAPDGTVRLSGACARRRACRAPR